MVSGILLVLNAPGPILFPTNIAVSYPGPYSYRRAIIGSTRMARRAGIREIPEAIERTWSIAERCNLKIEQVASPFPEFQVPGGDTPDSHFEKVVREGFAERAQHLETQAALGNLRRSLADYEARLTNEIQMIKRMKFPGYFLVVWDFIRYARAQGIPVGPGRGSPAGSLVSYALRITDVDPSCNTTCSLSAS